MTLTPQQNQLLDFVIEQHGDQKRKYIGTPYYTHPLAVAHIVDSWCNISMAIEVALCHDLFEDTPCQRPELYRQLLVLGYSEEDTQLILNCVGDLSDQYTKENYPGMNRADRKANEVKRLETACYLSKSVKLADLIHNTSSIVEHDPGFAVTYLREKRLMIHACRDGNIDLLISCCHSYFEAIKKLETKQTSANEVLSAILPPDGDQKIYDL